MLDKRYGSCKDALLTFRPTLIKTIKTYEIEKDMIMICLKNQNKFKKVKTTKATKNYSD